MKRDIVCYMVVMTTPNFRPVYFLDTVALSGDESINKYLVNRGLLDWSKEAEKNIKCLEFWHS